MSTATTSICTNSNRDLFYVIALKKHQQPTPTSWTNHPQLAMAVAAEEKDNGEEATAEDATEQQQDDAPTEADVKWIHSGAKKSLRTDIILGNVNANSNPKDVCAMRQSYKKFQEQPSVSHRSSCERHRKNAA
jgi:hypothetical protein